MKLSKILFAFSLLVIMFSCSEDTTDYLEGQWGFGNLFVNGAGATGSTDAIVSFAPDNTGEMDLWYIVQNDTIFKNGGFSYTATLDTVFISFNGIDEKWIRRDNIENEQEFQFNETVNQIEYSIIFDLVRQ
jgi:hypothetical protein